MKSTKLSLRGLGGQEIWLSHICHQWGGSKPFILTMLLMCPELVTLEVSRALMVPGDEYIVVRRSEFQRGENANKIPERACVGVFAVGTWRLSFQNMAFLRPLLMPQGVPLWSWLLF